MSHQPGHPPGYHSYSHPHSQAHPAYSPQPVPYGYAPPQEYQPELEALPSIRSLSSIPPVSAGTGDAGLGTGMGVGLGLGQPFYGVMPMGAQLVQSDFMARYPALPPDHRFRGPKKEIKRRTKTGCMTCRKRRIKCDETHPTCNNCRKSKRECLGYDPIFKQQQQQRPSVPTQNPEQRPPSHGAQTPQTPQPQPQPQPQPSLPTPHQPQGHLEERYLSYSSPISLQQQQTPAQTGPRDARAQALPSVAALSETYPPSSGGIDPSVLGPAPMQGFGHPSGNLGRPPFGPTEPLGGRQPGQGEPMVGRSLSGGDRNWGDRHLGLEPEFMGRPLRGADEVGGYGPDTARSAFRAAPGDNHVERGLRGVPS